MSHLCERLVVACPQHDATTRLAQYLREHTQSDGHVHLEMRVPVTIFAKERTLCERCVVATLWALGSTNDVSPTYSVTWEPDNGGPFPAFTGALAAHPVDENSDCVELVLTGHYDPPLEGVGAMFDATLGRRIAHATAHDLLERIAACVGCTAPPANPSHSELAR